MDLAITIDDKNYLSLDHYMEIKKYEGTAVETALLQCKTLKEFYSIITPQIYTYLSDIFFINKKECIIYNNTCYFQPDDWDSKKVIIFENMAKNMPETSIYYKIWNLYNFFIKNDIKSILKKYKIKKLIKEEFKHKSLKYLFFKNSYDENIFKILLYNILK